MELEKKTTSEPTLIVENISKRYSYDPILTNSSKLGGGKSQDKIKAIDSVSFSLCKGEILGVIGDNGSGKSTLLKLISGISNPTSGKITTHGRVASILEVGTGFHPDLSGKDNIFLSGAILGMSNESLKVVYADILKFSGLEDFIDLPVKKYSSGMYMRLAFSVVAHVNADIILLDEVFSVGDANFIRKSEKKIRELLVSDRTIIIAGHDLSSISKIASTLMVLKNGKIQYYGALEEGLNSYIESTIFQIDKGYPDEAERKLPVKKAVKVESIEYENKDQPRIYNHSDSETDTPIANSNASVIDSLWDIRYESSKKMDLRVASNTYNLNAISIVGAIAESVSNEQRINLFFDISVLSHNDYQLSLVISHNLQNAVLTSTPDPKSEVSQLLKVKGDLQFTFSLPPELLNSGVYSVSLYVIDTNGKEVGKAESMFHFKVVLSESFRKKIHFYGHFPGPLVSSFSWQTAS